MGAEEHIDSTSGQLEGHVENTLREKIRGGMCETKPKNIPCYLDFFGQMLSTGDTVLCVVQGVMTVAKVVELSSHFVAVEHRPGGMKDKIQTAVVPLDAVVVISRKLKKKGGGKKYDQ